ncbi:MAG: hypothetical protein HY744_09830 [Deltaproteobacteria bacterium]|nr:hypothetical protein [Deltaproteobacteria bacterium]
MARSSLALVSASAAVLAALALVRCSEERDAPALAAGGKPDGGPAADSGYHPGPYDAGAGHDGGAGGPPDAGTDADVPDWLYDPGLWEPVPSQSECAVHQAKLPAPALPRRVWSSCGVGCQVAPAPLLPFMSSWFNGVVATAIGSELYYHVASDADAHSGIPSLNEVARLSDDALVVLLKHSSECIGSSRFDSPLLFSLLANPSVDDQVDPTLTVGLGSPAVGSAVQWYMLPCRCLSLAPTDSISTTAGAGIRTSPPSRSRRRLAPHPSPRCAPRSPGSSAPLPAARWWSGPTGAAIPSRAATRSCAPGRRREGSRSS